MARPKVKGPGGLGQFDLGTATQDVRAATPQGSSGGSSDTSGGIVMGGAQGMYNELNREGKIPGRGKRRTGRSSGRKSR